MAYKFNPFTAKLDEYGPILTGTGTVSAAADGTAALPGIAFAADLNTGIYRPGPDQVAISTGGSGRLFVDASGNVGIGGSPLTALHLGGSSSQTIRINSNTSAGFVGTIGYITQIAANRNPIDGSIINTGTATAFINLEADVSNGNIQFCTTGTNNAAALERMRITSGGLVGVGTSSPAAKLHITDATGTAVELLRLETGWNSPSGNKSITWADGTNVLGRISVDYTAPAAAMRFGSLFNSGYQTSDLMTLTPTGLGIGTTSPGELLHVNGNALIEDRLLLQRLQSSDNLSVLTFSDTLSGSKGNNLSLGNPGGFDLLFHTGGVEKARIDSSGRLLVGTSSAETWYGSLVQIQASGSEASFTAIRNQNSASGSYIFLGKSRGTTANSATIVQSGDELGRINFLGADGTDIRAVGASISAEVDGTPGADDMPGRLVFSTTADGASSSTERMRIKNNGTINFSNVAVYADNAAATTGGLAVGDVYRTSTGQLMIRY